MGEREEAMRDAGIGSGGAGSRVGGSEGGRE